MTPADKLASRVVIHRLASRFLHEVTAWKPPTPAPKRHLRDELPGQLEIGWELLPDEEGHTA